MQPKPPSAALQPSASSPEREPAGSFSSSRRHAGNASRQRLLSSVHCSQLGLIWLPKLPWRRREPSGRRHAHGGCSCGCRGAGSALERRLPTWQGCGAKAGGGGRRTAGSGLQAARFRGRRTRRARKGAGMAYGSLTAHRSAVRRDLLPTPPPGVRSKGPPPSPRLPPAQLLPQGFQLLAFCPRAALPNNARMGKQSLPDAVNCLIRRDTGEQKAHKQPGAMLCSVLALLLLPSVAAGTGWGGLGGSVFFQGGEIQLLSGPWEEPATHCIGSTGLPSDLVQFSSQRSCFQPNVSQLHLREASNCWTLGEAGLGCKPCWGSALTGEAARFCPGAGDVCTPRASQHPCRGLQAQSRGIQWHQVPSWLADAP